MSLANASGALPVADLAGFGADGLITRYDHPSFATALPMQPTRKMRRFQRPRWQGARGVEPEKRCADSKFSAADSGLARWAKIDYKSIVQPPIAEIKKRLRELGLRVTAPRLAVLRILAEAERPLSHAEVVTLLGEDISLDRATVYRNLVALVEIGLARVASHAAGICRYELARGDAHDAHPHFLCDDCGVVSCLPETEVVMPKKTKWSKSLKAAEVQFVGRCPGCAGG